MTEEKNSPTPRTGIFLFLGKRKNQRRAFHIPTAPATAVRWVQNLNLKGASSTTVRLFPTLILQLEKSAWSKIKQLLRSAKARSVAALEQAIAEALAAITAENASAWFAHCNYGLQ